MKIQDSVVLVTGGASGIGEAIARYFHSKGALVYICDMQDEKGKKLESETNGKIKFIKCDITSEENVKKMLNEIKTNSIRIDTVINSAGISWGELIASEKGIHKSENFEKVMKVNVYGSFLVSKYAAKLMIETMDAKKECNGNIIFLGSVAAFDGQKGQTAYSASKGALVGMTLPMARDLGGFKIRVNCIAPGLILTPMSSTFDSTRVGKSILAATPLKRFGLPVEVASTAEYIASNDYVTGTVVRVDGGCRLPYF
jgi:NAD(P)-dependent dehydrogenase (short-subunit alcohol dehydrogenase family)